MPGTGHSARYKGSISNRSKVSPFEQLAKWNQQLLGADGAVPSIVNGGDLQFKKLDASDIAGVMHNPATEDLNMNNFNITNCNQLNTKFITNLQQISAISTAGLDIQSANGGGINMLTAGSNPKINMTIFSNSSAAPSPPTSQDFKIGYYGGVASGNINIGWDSTSTGNNDIFIGNGNNAAATQKRVFIMNGPFVSTAFHSLIMGNVNMTNASLQSLSTNIVGANTLFLTGNSISVGAYTGSTSISVGTNTGSTSISVGANSGSTSLGFLGAAPVLRSAYGVLGTNLITGASLADTVAMVQKIHDALVTVGLCEI